MTTPKSSGKHMSDSLKARLKRCGRTYASPVPIKRQSTVSSCPDSVTTVGLRPDSVTGSLRDSPVRHDFPQQVSTASSKKADPLVPTDSSSHFDTSEVKVIDNTTQGVGNPWDKQTASHKHFPPCSRKLDYHSDGSNDVTSEQCPEQACILSCDAQRDRIETLDSGDLTPLSKSQSDSADVRSHDTNSTDLEVLCHKRASLIQCLAAKEERLRKLKMVKMYRSKNDLTELESLISKWRVLCQDAVHRLHGHAPEPRPSVGELLTRLQIPHDMLAYSPEDDNFS